MIPNATVIENQRSAGREVLLPTRKATKSVNEVTKMLVPAVRSMCSIRSCTSIDVSVRSKAASITNCSKILAPAEIVFYRPIKREFIQCAVQKLTVSSTPIPRSKNGPSVASGVQEIWKIRASPKAETIASPTETTAPNARVVLMVRMPFLMRYITSSVKTIRIAIAICTRRKNGHIQLSLNEHRSTRQTQQNQTTRTD